MRNGRPRDGATRGRPRDLVRSVPLGRWSSRLAATVGCDARRRDRHSTSRENRVRVCRVGSPITDPARRWLAGSRPARLVCCRFERACPSPSRCRRRAVSTRAATPVPTAAAGTPLAAPARTAQAGAVLVIAGVGDDAPEAAKPRLTRSPAVERAAGVPAQRLGPIAPHTEPRDFHNLVTIERPGARLSDGHPAKQVRAVP